jgi:hypothetical protein
MSSELLASTRNSLMAETRLWRCQLLDRVVSFLLEVSTELDLTQQPPFIQTPDPRGLGPQVRPQRSYLHPHLSAVDQTAPDVDVF